MPYENFSEQSLVRANNELRHFILPPEIDTKTMFEGLPETIIDKESLRLAQVDDLFTAMNHTRTAVGAATLYRSLLQPSTSIDLIKAKQDSLQEICEDSHLHESLSTYLRNFSNGEQNLFRLLNKGYNRLDNGQIRAALKSGEEIIKNVEEMPTPQTPYAQYLIEGIRNYHESQIYRLMKGPIYRTRQGLQSKEDINVLTPRWKYIPRTIGGGLVYPIVASFGISKLRDMGIDSELLISLGVGGITATFMSLMYPAYMKRDIDDQTAVIPLQRKTVNDDLFISAIESIGALDELLSFNEYANSLPYPTIIPEITDDGQHHFRAENLCNPILTTKIENYLPNDVDLSSDRLNFVTGPNSGGKSTLCRSVIQTQIMAQIGSPIVASQATINIADRIAFQAPQYDALEDEEGRFGTELKRTKRIFESVSPKSLIILDELAEGTTNDERMRISRAILQGFNSIGNTTLMVTHNHELVGQLENLGQCLQVEFEGSTPTHKIIQGISTDSHADAIAAKIGFSPQDIQKYLHENGYISNTPIE